MSGDPRTREGFGPQRRYPYFERAEERAFRPASLEFEPVNLWWLADASLLSYVPEKPRVEKTLAGAGFETCCFFDEEGAHGFLAVHNAFAMLVFRGTDFTDLDDLKTDLDARPKAAVGKGRVHRGFREAHDRVAPQIAGLLEDVAVPVWVTGHSLGGALATMTAACHSGIHALVTFGSPRIGDKVFRNSFPVPAWRVVHKSDFVARIPPAGIYRHVGQRVYIDRDGRYQTDSGRIERMIDSVASQIDSESWDALYDHQPVRYARHAAAALDSRSS